MATNNRKRAPRSNNGRKTNNPKGRNQRDNARTESAKDRPLAAAIGAAAAVGAGMFLWSRRNLISDQISKLAEQVSEARESGGWASDDATDDTDGGTAARGDGRSQAEIAQEALTLKEIGAAS